MAGSVSKANGRQSQKRKRLAKPNFNIKVARMKNIPLICKGCGSVRLVSSQEAYKAGGVTCKCGAKHMCFHTENKDFGPTRTKMK